MHQHRVRGRRRPRTMAMARRRLSVQGHLSKIATTSLERSKWRFARLMFTDIVRSSPTSSPSLWRSRTATSSPRRSASCSRRLAPRSTATPRTARSSPGRSATSARRSPSNLSCDMQERLVCNYVPVESCSQEAKQYCHKVEKVVVEEVCDMKFDTQYL